MSTPEFKVGQLWYVDDDSEEGFACPMGSSKGDIIEIKDRNSNNIWYGYNYAQDRDGIVVYKGDLNTSLKYIGTKETHGHLVGASVEASDDASKLSYSEAPEDVESVIRGFYTKPYRQQQGYSLAHHQSC